MQHNKIVIGQPGQILLCPALHQNGQRGLDHVELVIGPALQLLRLDVASQLDERGVGLVEEQPRHQHTLRLGAAAAAAALGAEAGEAGDGCVRSQGAARLRIQN